MQPRHIKRIFAGKIILSFKSFRSIKGDFDFLSINMKQKRETKEMIERNVIKYKLCFMDSRNVIANRNDVMVLVRANAPFKSRAEYDLEIPSVLGRVDASTGILFSS